MIPSVAIGECLVELSLGQAPQALIGFAGDTFNTAVYLQRLGVPMLFATALGRDDPFSRGIVRSMADEGIDPRLVVEVEGRLPGLYAIETEPDGERRFFYWREASPARQLMDLIEPAALAAAMAAAPIVYLSAITLAVIGPAGRERLLGLVAQTARGGGAVCLDTNYRARLWPDPAAARAAVEAVAPHCRYVSLSAVDAAGFGLEAQDAAARWAAHGAEVVLRAEDGSIGVRSPEGEARLGPPGPCEVVDTTGAGDAFNAAYLAARIRGQHARQALTQARGLAQVVIAHRGAIIPRAAMPPSEPSA